MQAVCDRVGIIRDGQLVAIETVEKLISQRINRMNLIFEAAPPEGIFNFDGVQELEREKNTIVLEVTENLPQVLTTAAQYNIIDIETHNIGLEEIFLAYYSKENGGKHV